MDEPRRSRWMPKFLSRIPFWIWPVIGLACLIMSVPGFLGWQDAQVRQSALQGAAPEILDLEVFDPLTDMGAANEVHLFAQTSSDHRFLIDSSGIFTEQRYLVPIFSAGADTSERRVTTVLLVADLQGYEAWLAENVAGNARMGDLYAINGRVVDGRGYTASAMVMLRDAGFDQLRELTFIEPFVHGRDVDLAVPSISRLGNPLILALCGLYLCGVGALIWHRSRKVRHGVENRLLAMNETTILPPAEDRVEPTEADVSDNVRKFPKVPGKGSGKRTMKNVDAEQVDVVMDLSTARATPAE